MSGIQVGDLVQCVAQTEWAPKGPGLVIGKEQRLEHPRCEEFTFRFHVMWFNHNYVRYGYLPSRLKKLEIPNE
jgi:hypothetical protein